MAPDTLPELVIAATFLALACKTLAHSVNFLQGPETPQRREKRREKKGEERKEGKISKLFACDEGREVASNPGSPLCRCVLAFSLSVVT